MGLRKSIRKVFYYISFQYRFRHDIRGTCLDVDNFADPIILNPHPRNNVNEIPKIIWLYWDSNPSELILNCFEKIKKLNPTYQVNILNSTNVKNFCHIDFSEIPYLTPQQKSDLIRFNLLYNYGGFWLDASIIIYQGLDWIIDFCKKNNTSSFGYYRLANTTLNEYPVIENWLLASTKGNTFFKYWEEELTYALKLGITHYIKDIKIKHLDYEDYFQNIKFLEYLIAYVACQKVQRKYKISISLINCDQNAFFYQNLDLKHEIHFVENMILYHRPKIMPYLIKLIGSERKRLTPYFSKNKYKKNSLLDFQID